MSSINEIIDETGKSFKQTFKFESNCFNLIAVANPDGPPPIITTSYSIDSLDII